jgi:hypothetical protein
VIYTDQTTLEFQKAKLTRLEETLREKRATKFADAPEEKQLQDKIPIFEIAETLPRAIAKCKRRIARLQAPPVKEEKVKESKKLTQEEKAKKKKDYERQRKDRYKKEGK